MRNTGRRVPAGMRVSGPVRLGNIVQQQVLELWWRQRRHHGVDLPAERGVVAIEGGR
jgi:hypothetical protein